MNAQLAYLCIFLDQRDDVRAGDGRRCRCGRRSGRSRRRTLGTRRVIKQRLANLLLERLPLCEQRANLRVQMPLVQLRTANLPHKPLHLSLSLSLHAGRKGGRVICGRPHLTLLQSLEVGCEVGNLPSFCNKPHNAFSFLNFSSFSAFRDGRVPIPPRKRKFPKQRTWFSESHFSFSISI